MRSVKNRKAKILQVLQTARYLIENPERWTQQAPARNAKGRPLDDASSHYAVCWCATGAIGRTSRRLRANRTERNIYDLCCEEVMNNRGDSLDLVKVNDDYGHADVLILFDEAIKRLSPAQ